MSIRARTVVSQISNWERVKQIIDRVHLHVSWQSNFGYVELVLNQNLSWNDTAHENFSRIATKCGICHVTSLRRPSRQVAFSSLSHSFDHFVRVDRIFLVDSNTVHIKESKSRRSSLAICNCTSLETAKHARVICCFKPFWRTALIIDDDAFIFKLFKAFVTSWDHISEKLSTKASENCTGAKTLCALFHSSKPSRRKCGTWPAYSHRACLRFL